MNITNVLLGAIVIYLAGILVSVNDGGWFTLAVVLLASINGLICGFIKQEDK